MMKKFIPALLAALFVGQAFADGVTKCPTSNMPTPTISYTPNPVSVGTYQSGGTQTSKAISLSIGNKYSGGGDGGGTVSYSLSIVSNPSNGTASLNSSTLTYYPNLGYAGSDSVKVKVLANCKVYSDGSWRDVFNTTTVPISVVAPLPPGASMGGSLGNVSQYGAVILDNTPNPGTSGVSANMQVSVGSASSNTDRFSNAGLQAMQRQSNNDLWDEIGVTNASAVASNKGATAEKNAFFISGLPVIDLARYRTAADWLKSNIGSGSNHPSGTYGTISWKDFVSNVANGRTMWGLVRVKVPLYLKQGTDGATEQNMLGSNISSSKIYNFCVPSGGDGGTSCSDYPVSGLEFKSGNTINGYSMSSSSKLDVRGAIFFDVVNATGDSVNSNSGTPISPANLPKDPYALLIKINLPVSINPVLNSDSGVMQNTDYIDGLSKNISCDALPCTYKYPNPQAFDYTKVDQSVKDRFAFQTGSSLTSSLYSSLNTASKYHMLMPIGYEQGWAAAFSELQLKASKWQARGFLAPAAAVSADRVMTASDIRSEEWEDVPALLSVGPMLSLRHHVNISGLIYTNRAIEFLQTKQSSTRQYVMGSVITRDGFYIDANGSSTSSRGVTVLSSDPNCFAQLRVTPQSGLLDMNFKFAGGVKNVAGSAGQGASGNAADGNFCAGCGGTTGTGASIPASNAQYVIIRPQP